MLNKVMIKFSANISLLFTEFEFLDRFNESNKLGFNAVEFQFPYEYDPHAIKRKLKQHHLSLSIFNSPPGNFKNGDRGLACLPERKKEFKESIATAIEYAEIINGKNIHVMAGLCEKHDDLTLKETYIENIKWACDQFQKNNLTLLIEPINQRNIPSYFLSSTDFAIDLINIIDRSNLKLLFDIYHHQIIRGDVTKYLEKYFPYIGHIQIAGIPNRNEPDDSELDYSYVFKVIKDLNYNGWIGCEYNPKEGTVSGLKWISEVNL